ASAATVIPTGRRPSQRGGSIHPPTLPLFAGPLDEVSVFNRPLSGGEVQSIFTAGSRGKTLGNLGTGITIEDGASNNTVGGTAAGSRNVISGNRSNGVYLVDNTTATTTTGNTVAGNWIGLDAAGVTNFGNWMGGVRINSTPGNTVGGTTAAARNVITGNDDYGVFVTGSLATGNVVEGNYFGTNPAGTAKLGPSFGIYVIDV